jgi:hypothetical protein
MDQGTQDTQDSLRTYLTSQYVPICLARPAQACRLRYLGGLDTLRVVEISRYLASAVGS